MCLRIEKTLWNKVFKPKYKLAKEDIPVIKVLVKRGNSYDSYTSPYRGAIYPLNQTKPSDLGTIWELPDYYEVETGLHSIIDDDFIENHMSLDCVALKAYVPKGAWYLKGNDGDIVSNKLFVTLQEYIKPKF